MNWMKNMKIGTQLLTGFSIMIFFMVAIGLTGYLGLNILNKKLENISEVSLPRQGYLLEADRDFQQLLVAERSMIFSNVNSDEFEDLMADYEENLKQSQERMEKYKALTVTEEEKALMNFYEKDWEEWKTVSIEVVEGRKADTREGRRLALDLTLGASKDKFETMRDYIDKLTGLNQQIAEKESQDAAATYRKTILLVTWAVGFGLAAGLFFAVGIGYGVTNRLKAAIMKLTEASDQASSASEQLSESSQSLSEGASEQAASVEETSSSLEEISSMIKQSANNSKIADTLMSEVKLVINTANDFMTQLSASMKEITVASEETSKIVKTIDEIAFQTNLLALNAAVEAARAGEAGAGFAVVADEVRNLAMRAAEAAKNTSQLIEVTVRKVNSGDELSEKTSQEFVKVAESTKKVAELVGEIAIASDEQAQGIGQIGTAVEEINTVTQKNAANAEESAAASEEMSAQAAEMKSIVEDLKTLIKAPENGLSKHRKAFANRADLRPQNMREEAPTRRPPKKLTSPLKKDVQPDQVIPLDDGNFSDF